MNVSRSSSEMLGLTVVAGWVQASLVAKNISVQDMPGTIRFDCSACCALQSQLRRGCEQSFHHRRSPSDLPVPLNSKVGGAAKSP